jgi:hypothetical protein
MTNFLTESSLLLFRGTHPTHSLGSSSYMIFSMCGERVSRLSRFTPLDNEFSRPIALAPEECYWSGLNEALPGSHEDHRGALRDVDGNSIFTQQFLKVA